MSLTAVAGLLCATALFATWSYVAQLAVIPEATVNLEDALQAYDDGDLDLAKKLIGDLQHDPADAHLLGGALFVLGAIKSADADAEYSAARRRASHMAAGRYLQKANSLGFPEGREVEGTFLMGRSLVLGNQLHAGIDALSRLLDKPGAPALEIHSLLVQAQLDRPTPDLGAAFRHNDYILNSDAASERRRRQAQFRQIEILLMLDRIDAAKATLDRLEASLQQQSRVQVLFGRIEYAQAAQEPDEARRNEALDSAIDRLRAAQQEIPAGDPLARQAMYWIGRALKAQNKLDAANAQFDALRAQYVDTGEGIAAGLERANHELAARRFDDALLMYRQLLESAGDPLTYVNPLLPLAELRKELRKAYQKFLADQRFAEALELVNHLHPIYRQDEQVELRAEAYQAWGSLLSDRAQLEGRFQGAKTRREARIRFRTAARDFERLARIRYSTRSFTSDLWNAAEAYYVGQSYTNSARVFREFLHHEARRQNSLALLRMGQSWLAAGDAAAAHETLLECIEMYPRDAVVYTARIEAARAARQLGRSDEAEELLRTNLTGDSLNPRSPEWRDSLFELGQMFYDARRYDEAITTLLEAVDRYPQANQSLLAQYTIARSHHSIADQLAEPVVQTKTELERRKKHRLASESLENALQAYQTVQRMITLHGDSDSDPLQHTVLRNCYMMQGSVLYDLRRFEDARQAYANVSGLYQNEPTGLESFVKIAECWRRLDQPVKARGAIEQAKLALDRIPQSADFQVATNFSREQWTTLLDQMSTW